MAKGNSTLPIIIVLIGILIVAALQKSPSKGGSSQIGTTSIPHGGGGGGPPSEPAPTNSTEPEPLAPTNATEEASFYIADETWTRTQSFQWGTLVPGQNVSKVLHPVSTTPGVVYTEFYATAYGWVPPEAEKYFNLTFDYKEDLLWLYVSPQIQNITTFSFNITMTGVYD